MGFLNLFKQKEKDYLILDVSTYSIKGLIFSPAQRKIKGYSCQKIERSGVFNGRDFEFEVIKNSFQKIIKELNFSKRIPNLKAKIIFSPDILKARLIEIHIKREKEGRIEKKEKEEIYQEVFFRTKREVEKEISQRFNWLAQEIEIVKVEIVEERISGYPVPTILGMKGEDLVFKVLIIFLRKDWSFNLNILRKILPIGEIEICHEVEGLIRYFQELKDSGKIFVDIGQNNTAIFGFKETLEFVEEFQIGGGEFTKLLKEDLGIGEREAEVLKEKFSQKKLSVGVQRKIEGILKKALENWLESFEGIIKERFPSFAGKILLFGGGSLLPQIKNSIQNSKILKIKGFEVRAIPLFLLTLTI